MVQAGPMNYPSALVQALKPLGLLALACLTSLNGIGDSNVSISDQRLARTNLLIFRDTKGAVRPVKSVRDWQKRRAEIVRNMEEVMGPLPGKDKRCPLD